MLIFLFPVFLFAEAEAGNVGAGIHVGYGSISHTEYMNTSGNHFQSESTLPALLFGVSGEYSFSFPGQMYIGLTTDWVFGFENNESWNVTGVEETSSRMKFFGQFYDLRIGYKKMLDAIYYRMYVSAGWDGLSYERDWLFASSIPFYGAVEEDIGLWRAGVGSSVGFRKGPWALDMRAAYAYYPSGRVETSSLSHTELDTIGTCLDIGTGLAVSVSDHVSFYVGGSYTLLKLDRSDSFSDGLITVRYRGSKTEFIAGMVNLGYSF